MGQTVTEVHTFSSGKGSWASSRRVQDRRIAAGLDPKTLALVFSDVLGEDEDNYRFLVEAAADIYGVALPAGWQKLVPTEPVRRREDVAALREFAIDLMPGLIWLIEGRTIWEVFRDNRFLGNTRLANCSKFLKQMPAREWIEANCFPEDTVIYVGIDWMETHRLPDIQKAYLPYRAEAPLCEAPYIDSDDVLEMLAERNIDPPRLYKLGFQHANCGGGCVRAGQAQFATLLEIMPTRYAAWEAEEEGIRQHLDKPVSILRERRRAHVLTYHGLTENDVKKDWYITDSGDLREREIVIATGKPVPKVAPITLREFRERHQADANQTDLDDTSACDMCFTAPNTDNEETP
jgi:hypothetical protein